MRHTWRVCVPLLVLLAVSAQETPKCARSKSLFTYDGCPAQCRANPCVLFDPSTPCVQRNAAGPCYNETQSLEDGECVQEFHCVQGVFDPSSSYYVFFADVVSRASIAGAPVEAIASVKYPDGAFLVQWNGYRTAVKGVVKNVEVDDTLVQTPVQTATFNMLHMNLRSYLASAKPSTNWRAVTFENVNLDQVPDSWSELRVKKMRLNKNFLTSFPEEGSAAYPGMLELTSLNLSENNLESFNTFLPRLEELDLSFNAIKGIPPVLFKMSVRQLYLRGNSLDNVQVTPEQFTFLSQLQVLEAPFTVTGCADGYGEKVLRDSYKICVEGEVKETTEEEDGDNTLVIVLSIVGGVVLVAAIAAFVIFRRRKPLPEVSSTVTGKQDVYSNFDTDMTYGQAYGADPMGSSSIWNDPDLLAVRIEYQDIVLTKMLSRGGFGEVWLGEYMNQSVAVKRLLSDKRTMTDALAFASEIKVMARLDHPKIVRFIGVAWTNALTIQAVTEYMDHGDLKSLLESPQGSALTWASLKCQIAIDVADALVYLHTLNPKMIHRDLKSRNVLIDSYTGAKLSDFGISRNRSLEETMTAGVGTSRWIAPEVILGGHYTEFADIYSFGVVLSELDTCSTPYHDACNTNGTKMQDVTILQQVSAGKLQPSFSNTCPESIYKLARACLSFDPSQRPSAIHISYELRKILRDELSERPSYESE